MKIASIFVDLACQPLLSSSSKINAVNIEQSNMGSRNGNEISVLMHDCRFLFFLLNAEEEELPQLTASPQ